MLPSIPLALLAALLSGLVFAWAARGPFLDGRNPWGDEVRAVASYEILIRWPLLLYFYLLHREWSLLYLVRAEHLPGWLTALLLPLDAAAMVVGYFSGWSLLRRGAKGTLQLAMAAVAAALGWGAAAWRDRLLRDTDVISFGLDGRPAVDGRHLAIALVAFGGSVLAAVFVYRVLAAASARRKNGGGRSG